MQKLISKLLLALLSIYLLIGINLTSTIAETAFEKFQKQQQQGLQNIKEEQEKGIAELEKAYEEFYEKRRKAFQKFKQKITSKWGKENVRLPSKKKWVSYEENYNQRHGADFEGGEAYAEIIVDKEELDKNPEAVKEKLRVEVKKLVTDKGKKDDIEKEIEEEKDEEIEKPEPPKPEKKEKEPLLAGQLKNKKGETVTDENAAEFAKEVTTEEKIEKKELPQDKGKEKVIVSVKMPLVSDHLLKRARKFKKIVHRYARQYQIPAPLVFALIQTESSFNPRARSHIPAYGLMQLVPSSGGKDAYRHIYGKSKLLGPDFLYQPENNIELGIGYLNLLMTRYLASIDNMKSRTYCAIAAYNTGAGNVARAFNGTTNIHKAADRINRLSPPQVYSTLRSSLPYEETKKYVKKIRTRRPKYEAWRLSATEN
jgi:membrane-bound lytic murein transglycosylase C